MVNLYFTDFLKRK